MEPPIVVVSDSGNTNSATLNGVTFSVGDIVRLTPSTGASQPELLGEISEVKTDKTSPPNVDHNPARTADNLVAWARVHWFLPAANQAIAPPKQEPWSFHLDESYGAVIKAQGTTAYLSATKPKPRKVTPDEPDPIIRPDVLLLDESTKEAIAKQIADHTGRKALSSASVFVPHVVGDRGYCVGGAVSQLAFFYGTYLQSSGSIFFVFTEDERPCIDTPVVSCALKALCMWSAPAGTPPEEVKQKLDAFAGQKVVLRKAEGKDSLLASIAIKLFPSLGLARRYKHPASVVQSKVYTQGCYELREITDNWTIPGQVRRIWILVYTFADHECPSCRSWMLQHVEFGRFFSQESAQFALDQLRGTWGVGAYAESELPRLYGGDLAVPKGFRQQVLTPVNKARLVPGDHVVVVHYLTTHKHFYQHHGIFVNPPSGTDLVVHFFNTVSGAIVTLVRFLSFGVIRQDQVSVFRGGSPVIFKFREALPEGGTAFTLEQVNTRALDAVQARGGKQARYHLLAFNCEHAATWLRTGVGHSSQTRTSFARAAIYKECLTSKADVPDDAETHISL